MVGKLLFWDLRKYRSLLQKEAVAKNMVSLYPNRWLTDFTWFSMNLKNSQKLVIVVCVFANPTKCRQNACFVMKNNKNWTKHIQTMPMLLWMFLKHTWGQPNQVLQMFCNVCFEHVFIKVSETLLGFNFVYEAFQNTTLGANVYVKVSQTPWGRGSVCNDFKTPIGCQCLDECFQTQLAALVLYESFAGTIGVQGCMQVAHRFPGTHVLQKSSQTLLGGGEPKLIYQLHIMYKLSLCYRHTMTYHIHKVYNLCTYCIYLIYTWLQSYAHCLYILYTHDMHFKYIVHTQKICILYKYSYI